MTRPFLLAVFVMLHATVARAQVVDKYNITPQEQADCQMDAATLCSAVYPDEDKLITCMRANRTSLSPRCLKTFTAGLARRHM